MDKKKQKGSVWDGIKIAVGIFEAVDTINTMNRSKWDDFVEMVALYAAAAVVGGLWVMFFFVHW
jgi:hypothetical protein